MYKETREMFELRLVRGRNSGDTFAVKVTGGQSVLQYSLHSSTITPGVRTVNARIKTTRETTVIHRLR